MPYKGQETKLNIRDAEAADMAAITEIYNQVLLTSTAVYSDEPVTVDDRLQWLQTRRDEGFPVLVAEVDGTVAGFATFGAFRAWPGYRFTVEGTIHIREGVRGKGLGHALLAALFDRARAQGKHSMIAGVDSENAASLRFLEGVGFVRAGHLREVGFKFGRFLDLIFLQYDLTSRS